MEDKELAKYLFELLKTGILSVTTIYTNGRTSVDEAQILASRNALTGKYTSTLPEDINFDDVKNYCNDAKHKINMFPSFSTDANGLARQSIGVDNRYVAQIAQSCYAKALNRNKNIRELCDQLGVESKRINASFQYRIDGSHEGYVHTAKYNQFLYLDEKNKDVILNNKDFEYFQQYIHFLSGEEFDSIKDLSELNDELYIQSLQDCLAGINTGEKAMNELGFAASFYDESSKQIYINSDDIATKQFIENYYPDLQNSVVYMSERELFEETAAKLNSKIVEINPDLYLSNLNHELTQDIVLDEDILDALDREENEQELERSLDENDIEQEEDSEPLEESDEEDLIPEEEIDDIEDESPKKESKKKNEYQEDLKKAEEAHAEQARIEEQARYEEQTIEYEKAEEQAATEAEVYTQERLQQDTIQEEQYSEQQKYNEEHSYEEQQQLEQSNETSIDSNWLAENENAAREQQRIESQQYAEEQRRIETESSKNVAENRFQDSTDTEFSEFKRNEYEYLATQQRQAEYEAQKYQEQASRELISETRKEKLSVSGEYSTNTQLQSAWETETQKPNNVGKTIDEINEEIRIASTRNFVSVGQKQEYNATEKVLNSTSKYLKAQAKGTEIGRGKKEFNFALSLGQTKFASFDYKDRATSIRNCIVDESKRSSLNLNKKNPLSSQFQSQNIDNAWHNISYTAKQKNLDLSKSSDYDKIMAGMKSKIADAGLNSHEFIKSSNLFVKHGDTYKMTAKANSLFQTKNVADAMAQYSIMVKMFEADKYSRLANKLAGRRSITMSKFSKMSREDDTMSSVFAAAQLQQRVRSIKDMQAQISDRLFMLKTKKNNVKLLKYNQNILANQTKAKAFEETVARKVAQTGSAPANQKILDQIEALKAKNAAKQKKYQARIDKVNARYEKVNAKKDQLLNKKEAKLEKLNKKAMKKTVLGKKEIQLKKLQAKLAKMQASGASPAKIAVLKKKISKMSADIAKKKAKKKALSEIGNKFLAKLNFIKKPAEKVLSLGTAISEVLKKVTLFLAKAILIVLAAIFLFWVEVLIIISFYAMLSMVAFPFTGNSMPVSENPLYKTYVMLKDTECDWINDLNEIVVETHDLSDFDKSTDPLMIDIGTSLSAAISKANIGKDLSAKYVYDNGKIVSDPLLAGDGFKGSITQVDGGGYVLLRNMNNSSSVSNIKDILALTLVHYDENLGPYQFDITTGNLDDIVNTVSATVKDSIAGFVSGIKSNLMNLFSDFLGTAPVQKANYTANRDAVAFGAYATTLYSATHETAGKLKDIIMLPTDFNVYHSNAKQLSEDEKDMTAEAIIAAAGENRDGYINGVRAMCPDAKNGGCVTSTSDFFVDDGKGVHAGSLEGPSNVKQETLYGAEIELKFRFLVQLDDSCIDLWSTSDTEKLDSGCWHEEIIHHEKEEDEIIIVHECKGHIGHYCGGHVVTEVTGLIHGIPTSLALGQDSAREDVQSYIYESERTESKVTEQATISTAGHDATDDIFEIDASIEHVYTPKKWYGWTMENIDQASLKYQQDWAQLYGLTFENSLVGAASNINGVFGEILTGTEIKDILDKVAENEDLTDVARAHLELGLSYVGKAGYDQSRHASCKFIENGGPWQAYTDCSGFASNVWYDVLGEIRSCAGFKSDFSGSSCWHSVADGGYKPGDIFLTYGSSSNHAMVYVGTIDGEIMCVESTSYNSGGIFYMGRGNDWYNKCYYMSMSDLY